MFGHGVVRIPKIQAFANGMAEQFRESVLPEWVVLPYACFVPVAELLIGILLLGGVFTKQALIAGAVLILSLMVGACLIENWNALPSQMIHLAYFAVLIGFVNYDLPLLKKRNK